jgi:hypothetical protein
MTISSFQSAASAQGRRFALQCDGLLTGYGYALNGCVKVPRIGVEVDQAATSPNGRPVWFEYKGSVQGARPGLLRTDTLKKAIANGALIASLAEHPPYIVLTSHLPAGGAGREMLEASIRMRYLADVICIYDPQDQLRLKAL